MVAPLAALVVCSVLAAAFVYEARSQNALLSRITERDLGAFNHYAQVVVNLTSQHTELDDLLDNARKLDEGTLYDEAKQHIYEVVEAVRELEETLPSTNEGATSEFAALRYEVYGNVQAYRKAINTAVAMATVNTALAQDRLSIANERFTVMNRSFVRLLDLERIRISSEIAERVRQSQVRNTSIAAAGISIAALLFFLSRILARMLSGSIETQIGVLAELGAQAGARPPVEASDEVERMTQAIGAFRHSLTELREGEQRVRRLNRVYAVLSGINTLIVRVGDREELFREACRIAVEHGRFKVATIGIIDRDTRQVSPVALAGADSEFMAALRPRLSLDADGPDGVGVVALAINDRKAVVVNDVESDPRLLQRNAFSERGIHSMAVLPLQVADEPVGVLALFAAERDFFDDAEEMRLLVELAGDIGFALDHLEKGARLEYLAYYDALTGLANRSLFLERVAQHLRSAASGGHKLALFLMDLERFKNINDSLGRAAGDALLKQVAQWLAASAGDATLVARIGADLFAVVLPVVRPEGNVMGLLDGGIEAFLAHSFLLGGAELRIAAKAGVALFPDDGLNAETLFRNAEAALKKAKAGNDRYLFYTQKMTAAVADKLTLESQLREALDKGEFVLHYQPKVSLANGKLTGAEALIRWNDPRTGLVPPGRFIPVLEEMGLIHEVGRWALRQAIADCRRWRDAGLPAVRIAVNVSPLQLRSRGFVDDVRHAVGIDSHAAAGLELEITESLIMEDVEHSITKLQAIRDMGVTIAIDDFGTGFSSLSYLAKLPVDTLKIDRTFVADMTAGPQGLSLVSTIVNLAHSLKLKVVAEGVETEEQSRLLRLMRCDEMQGFLFSKAVPGDEFQARFLTLPLAA